MNVRLILILLALIIPATNGWFWRRRRRNPPPPRRNNNNGWQVTGQLGCPGGHCTGTVGVTKNWGDRTSLGGHVTCGGGGCGAGVRFTHTFGKRSAPTVEPEKFQVAIQMEVDACDFHSYDRNNDTAITRDELERLFGKDVLTDALLDVLDTKPADEKISAEEFAAGAPKHIAGCD